MTDYVFPLQPQPAVAVRGQAALYPVFRIFCVGRNYEAHAREMGFKVDLANREAPFYFTKPANALVASGATIPFPLETKNYHHEMELVVAIGAPAFRVSVEKALDCVYGYAPGLDMTRRDLQLAARDKGRPWDFGKAFENSAVIGEIVRAAQIGHPSAGRIHLDVNGRTKQDANIKDLIWNIAEIVADLSRFYHLQPGDLIYTGTPEGVGPVQPGDVLEGAVEGVGAIKLVLGQPE